jgi:glycosyltransferase involved in cell wall biosynthesis
MKKEILFISHEASRSGAPILLLQFLRWFKENTDISFRIILVIGGELEAEFAKLGPTLVFEQKFSPKLYERIKTRFFPFDPSLRLKQWFVDTNIGLIYSNTVVNGNILEDLKFLDCPIISHAHELEYIIQCYGIDSFEKTKRYTTHFIACANVVKDNLVENHNILSQNISVIHEFTPIDAINENSLNLKLLESELNLSEPTFIVGGSGSSSDWRKGADLFIQLAYIVKSKAKNISIRFVWIGKHQKGAKYLAVQQDIVKADLENYIHFIGSKSNPLDYFSGFDLFALTSREDPYPVVCLESALLGKPIICFDKGGGEPEFVENDCGFVIPYLDLNTMANRIIELYHSPELRQMLGENAKKKVIERHSLEIAASKILEVIRSQI